MNCFVQLSAVVVGAVILHTPIAIVVWPSSSSFAFTPLPQRINRKHIIQNYAHPTGSDDPSCYITTDNTKQITIQKIALDDSEQLQRMSKFCINMFYNSEEDDELGTSLLSRKWKDIQLYAMQKAQLLEISLSTENRCIVVAKSLDAYDTNEIIGVCEVIEERLDTSLQQNSSSITEKERRKNGRMRAVIENLCVKADCRQSGIGSALVQACEKDVQQWLGHDEIFAQVDIDNNNAYKLFRKCGYHLLFEDPTCTNITMDDSSLLPKEITVTKRMMRKILGNGQNAL